MVRHVRKAKKKSKGEKKKGSSSSSTPVRVWRPGVDRMEAGEELQCDLSAYNSLHAFHVGWPCLSFDFISDQQGKRSGFPHTVHLISGTQANKASLNSIAVSKLSNITGKKREPLPGGKPVDGDETSDSDSDEGDETKRGSLPNLQTIRVAHDGCVNRIRAMPQIPSVCASWADTGHVQVWDLKKHLDALEAPNASAEGASVMKRDVPSMRFDGHKDEGYAIDWNTRIVGRLLSGDCKSGIHVWEPCSGTWAVDPSPFVGHGGSVEDLQWSPTEEDVFASCSADGTIAVWDTRQGKSSVVSMKAHAIDVNVISWNRMASCLLASGSDDGRLGVRDLRLLKEGDPLVASFDYHKRSITSIEWSPDDASVLAVSSSDNQLTVWDLSMERDEEEEEVAERMKVSAESDLPPQLLFVHQGQNDPKELHWHPRIQGMIMCTAADGFNLLMPSNVNTAS